MAEVGIVASITGIITVACQLYSRLSDFVDNVAEAPNSARNALTTVHHASLILSSVRDVVETLSGQPPDNTILGHLQNLKVILRDSVQTFAELQTTVGSVGKCESTGISWDRLGWLREEKDINCMLGQLESQKASISVLLSVLQCQQVAGYMERFGAPCSNAGHPNGTDHEMLNPHSKASAIELPRSVPPHAELKSCEETAARTDLFVQPFEFFLRQTHLYRRVRSDATSAAFKSSNPRSHAWSTLSEISIDKTSNISVFAMPIACQQTTYHGSERSNVAISNAICRVNQPISHPASCLAFDDWNDVSSDGLVPSSQHHMISSRHEIGFNSESYNYPWCLDITTWLENSMNDEEDLPIQPVEYNIPVTVPNEVHQAISLLLENYISEHQIIELLNGLMGYRMESARS